MSRRAAWMAAGLALWASTASGNPWAAADRLGGRAVPGNRFRLEGELLTREAIPGAWQSEFRMGSHRKTGWGWQLRGRASIESPTPAVDGEGELSRRSLGGEVAVGGGVLQWRGHRQVRVQAALRWLPSPVMLAELTVEAFPGEAGGAPRVRAGWFGGRGPWMGAIRVGPRAQDWEAGLAGHLSERLVVLVRLVPGRPGVGVAMKWGRSELRAETEQHARLGRIGRIRLVWVVAS